MSDTMPRSSSSVSWKVVSQTPTQVKLPTGAYTDGMRITATLPNGAAFTVDVPQDQYQPDTVIALLREKAQAVAAVHASTS